MRLETADGCLFTLDVDRYEFPYEELGPTEDNPADEFDTGRFLIVSHTFRNSDGEWRAKGPTMTTTELRRFVDWLISIENKRIITNGVYFTERDLEFSVDDAITTLRVHVFRDFLPKWARSKDSITINFPISFVQFGPAIASLMQQLINFPGRPPIPTEG